MEQRNTTPIFDRYKFLQMVDPLTNYFMRLDPRAVTKLHVAAENYMARFVQKCKVLAIQDKRSIFHLTDLEATSLLTEDYTQYSPDDTYTDLGLGCEAKSATQRLAGLSHK